MASRPNLSLQKIPPAQVVLFLLLLMVIIGVAYYFLMYTDMDKQITGINGQINQQNLVIAELEDKRRNLVEVQKKAETIEGRLAQLQARLPSTVEELNDFLSDISQRKQNARIDKWLKYQPQAPIPQGNIKKIPVSMTFISSYDAATEFFWELSTMGEGIKTGGREQLVNVSSISLERKPDLPKGLVHVKCVVETYLFDGSGAEKKPDSRADRRRRRRGGK